MDSDYKIVYFEDHATLYFKDIVVGRAVFSHSSNDWYINIVNTQLNKPVKLLLEKLDKREA